MKIYRRNRSYDGIDPYQNGEVQLWKFIQEKFRPEKVFDVGVCKSSFIVDERLDEDISVWLFEPSPIHIRDVTNKYQNKKNVFIRNFGFGDIDNQSLKIYPTTDSLVLRNKTVPDSKIGTKTLEVICKTIDSFFLQESIEKLDYLKIDVEGYELKVLEGAKSSLGKIRLIQFEFGGTYIDAGITLKEILDLFPERSIYAIEREGLNKMTFEQAAKEKLHNRAYSNFLVSLEEFEITEN